MYYLVITVLYCCYYKLAFDSLRLYHLQIHSLLVISIYSTSTYSKPHVSPWLSLFIPQLSCTCFWLIGGNLQHFYYSFNCSVFAAGLQVNSEQLADQQYSPQPGAFQFAQFKPLCTFMLYTLNVKAIIIIYTLVLYPDWSGGVYYISMTAAVTIVPDSRQITGLYQ